MTTAEQLELATTRAAAPAATTPMKALVFHGPGKRAWEDRPRPALRNAGDAIVRLTTSTICGTDLHILKGDVPSVTDGRILGHEGIGVIEELGAAVSGFHAGGGKTSSAAQRSAIAIMPAAAESRPIVAFAGVEISGRSKRADREPGRGFDELAVAGGRPVRVPRPMRV